jgi:hypothetical protein
MLVLMGDYAPVCCFNFQQLVVTRTLLGLVSPTKGGESLLPRGVDSMSQAEELIKLLAAAPLLFVALAGFAAVIMVCCTVIIVATLTKSR